MNDALEKLISPRRLATGGTIGIVAPSSGLAELFPHRIEKGVQMLEQMGFKVLFSEHARERDDWTSATAIERADDLNSMFASPEVDMILATIGGNHANQILKYLDYDLIKKNPKIFIGYSDITVLHYAIAKKAGLRTFYGPCLISEFGEFPEILQYTRTHFENALMHTEPIGRVEPSEHWTDEFLDWFQKKDLERPRELLNNEGYEWWREGRAEGSIWGGAIPSINHLAGTDYWINPADSILFIDIPEGNPGKPFSQSELDSFLADLDNLGIFASITGLIIGRPYQYGENEKDILKALIGSYTREYDYPILYNTNIGHAAPIITIPLGVRVVLDSLENRFEITESGVS